MSRYISTFMISMDHNIESHEIPESLVSEAEHLSVVGTIVKSGVSLWHGLHILIAVVEDDGSDSRNTSANIECILEGGIPVLALVDAVVVGLGKFAGWLASKNTC